MQDTNQSLADYRRLTRTARSGANRTATLIALDLLQLSLVHDSQLVSALVQFPHPVFRV